MPYGFGADRYPLAQENARNRGRTVTGVWFECSWGGAGMMIRVPSNRSLTPIARKGFRAPSRGLAIALAKWNLSAQIPLMGDTSRGREP